MLAELPDLWDVTSATGRTIPSPRALAKKAHQEKYISFVKQLTTKPVVGVGRYTSPDSMVSAIERGIMDSSARHARALPIHFCQTRSKKAARRYPRVHRLQYLRHWRYALRSHPLHTKPNHGRRVAA
jgi:2,4-dienoyl-CoA reductase-like NADH-dependent reductase (Old Yellow Enzyme family)